MSVEASSAVTIRSELRPGDLGRMIWLHGVAYESEPGHFGLKFEALVARTIAEFILDNNASGRVFLAERGADLVGSAAMIDRGGRGQLRWFLLAPSARGAGLGGKLLSLAMDFAVENDWKEVFLETTHGLDKSMALYRKLGFEVVGEEAADLWGGDETLVTMVKKLK